MRFSTWFLPRVASVRQCYGAIAGGANLLDRHRCQVDHVYGLASRQAKVSKPPVICSRPKAPMPSIEPLPLLVATFAFLIAGFVKGVIGLGLPTVSIGLLSLVMAPAKAASLLIVPSFVTNVWQLAAGPSFGRLARRLWPMLAGIVLGALAGTGWLTGSHAGQADVGLGLLLMLYAGLALTSVRFSAPPPPNGGWARWSAS